MDETMLSDLLECSVCLEQLDTSSKVLPCQHTFCRKCLEGIYKKHKELRCPECRVLVTIKIDDLPPNVLLMRILESIKNAGNQKKIQRIVKTLPNQVQLNNQQQSVQLQQQQQFQNFLNVSRAEPPITQPYAKALFDYVPKETGDLGFKKGDTIILKRRIDSNWCQGECNGKQGVFPFSYVRIIAPVPSHLPQCKALYDFRMSNDEDEGCLTFIKGDVINVIRRVDENWAEGKLDGKIGIFPLAFVELNNLARSLMKLSTNAQPGPSKLAPPTPNTDSGQAPLIPTDHTNFVMSANRNVVQQKGPAAESSGANTLSSSTNTSPNVSSSSNSSTAPSSPASPPTKTNRQSGSPKNTINKPPGSLLPGQSQPLPPHNMPYTAAGPGTSHYHHNKEKRHSLTNVLSPHHNGTHRHSAEVLQSPSSISSSIANQHPLTHVNQTTEKKLETATNVLTSPQSTDVSFPATFVAMFPYKPQKADELELKKGGLYIVSEICQDGWYKGTSNRTQKCGVFPGNYVARVQSASGGCIDTPADQTPVSHKHRKDMKQHRLTDCLPKLPPRNESPRQQQSQQQQQQEISVNEFGCFTKSAAASNIVPQTKCDKSKERREKGTVSLMRRLTSIKRSKSPPPSYSMDNPVFEDNTVSTQLPTASSIPAVHVRSGSCPSQLLQIHPIDHHHLMFGSTSHRIKHKGRPSILNYGSRSTDAVTTQYGGSSSSSPDIPRHKKSNSLDAGQSGRQMKSGTQTVREKFRCIAPYPPNSEYELELQINDIIFVHKKRDDGWYKGTQQRTGKTGLFPASFVENV